ncbi:hypothetical protein [Lactococcus garvieae]|uniref:hypothetical protein n=1 Tax=Lactococcus garvieae TaxID=1363 RepID=UPI0021AF26F9|nr:hypothetical protein [Lactococcus garvieae]
MTYNQTAQHSTAQHSTAQHSTAQHSTAQHSTAQAVDNRPFLLAPKTLRPPWSVFWHLDLSISIEMRKTYDTR